VQKHAHGRRTTFGMSGIRFEVTGSAADLLACCGSRRSSLRVSARSGRLDFVSGGASAFHHSSGTSAG
jgi:hypothetical protein